MSTSPIEAGSLLVGRYRIEAVLGIGGMATVYRASDESLGRVVAIKVFRDSLSDAKAVERQRAEVRLIASLQHPSLVTLFDAVVLDEASAGEHAFIVMQFIDGDDLGAELRGGPIAEDRAVAIGADVADALAYVHEQGVIHRDVKPGNILVPRHPRPSDPRALLADFGIARFIDGLALTATGSVLGTANYLSPEQALGQELTAATDVYALGLVLLEAISGERAFPGAGMEAVAARLAGDPVLPTGASDAVNSLLRSMTARQPEHRPTAASVADRLRELATTAELPATVAMESTPDSTVLLDPEDAAAYAPTRVMTPLSGATTPLSGATTVLPASATITETRSISSRRVIAVAAIALVALIAIVLAIALPHSTPQSVDSTPSAKPSATLGTSATSVPPTTAPVVVATPSQPSVTPVAPVPPGKNKPGKGNGNGHGHGKKP